MTSARLAGVIIGVALCAPCLVASGGTPREIAVPIPGSLELSAAGFPQERFALPVSVREALLHTDDGQSLAIADWPAAPGRRQRVTLTRRRVVDPDARIQVVTNDGARPVAASARVHFWGSTEGVNGRIMLSLDPSDGSARGFSVVDGEIYEVRRDGTHHVVLPADERITAAGGDPDAWTCGLEDGLLEDAPLLPATGETPAHREGESASRAATIAFDTDTELLLHKFNNSQAAALAYIADLVAAMNLMYESDLDITLLQGDTIIRIGSDPYTQNSGGNASSAELAEFGMHWDNNYDHIDRALAAMLSGKQPSDYAASGIAWVGGLCSHNYGYSFTKVFKIDYLAGDAFVAGHELGHNFGSRHTHCYSPPIDQCYASEGGCYSGPTSCPGGPGTVMSYCHVAGCGSNRMEFHSRVITNIINNHVDPATGICIFDGVETVFSDGFESGNLGAWSVSVP